MASNTILDVSMITNEALMVLENDLVFARGVTREYNDQFAVDGAKIGDTVNVRRPAQFVGTSGPALAVEDFYESSIPVVVGDTTKYGDQFHVDTAFTTKDLRLALGAFSDRVIKPAVATVANKVDLDGLTMAKNTAWNLTGTAGTTPTQLLTYLNAKAYLAAEACPQDGRLSMIVEPFTEAAIVDALKGLLQPGGTIGGQYTKGKMGVAAGMNWSVDQNVVSQSGGYWAAGSSSTLTADTTSIGIATGWAQTSTITLTQGATITLIKGDRFTIANVFAVNPQNRSAYGSNKLRVFTVQTTVTGTGSSTMSVTVSPAIITAGQFKNVTIPTTSATATVTLNNVGVSATSPNPSPQNILYHPTAFTMVSVDLELPGGVVFAGRASDKEAGLSIRVVRQYTINNDQIPARLDVLYGWAPLYNQNAAVVQG